MLIIQLQILIKQSQMLSSLINLNIHKVFLLSLNLLHNLQFLQFLRLILNSNKISQDNNHLKQFSNKVLHSITISQILIKVQLMDYLQQKIIASKLHLIKITLHLQFKIVIFLHLTQTMFNLNKLNKCNNNSNIQTFHLQIHIYYLHNQGIFL